MLLSPVGDDEESEDVPQAGVYLYSAKHSDGVKVIDTINIVGIEKISGIEKARALLEEKGFREIQFHDDDFSAQLRAQRPAEFLAQTPEDIERELEARQNPSGFLTKSVKREFKKLPGKILIGALFLAAGIYFRSFFLGFLAFTVVSYKFMFLALLWRNTATTKWYPECYRTFYLGEWKAFNQAVNKLRNSQMYERVPNLKFDLIKLESMALAKQGLLEQALKKIQAAQSYSHLPKGGFENAVAMVAFSGGHYAKAIEILKGVAQTSTLMKVDYAMFLARFSDTDEALRVLSEVDRKNLSEMNACGPLITEGIVFLRKGNTKMAIDKLSSALQILVPYSSNPITMGFISIVTGYLSVALALDGQKELAQRYLGPVYEVIRVHGDAPLKLMIKKEVLN